MQPRQILAACGVHRPAGPLIACADKHQPIYNPTDAMPYNAKNGMARLGLALARLIGLVLPDAARPFKLIRHDKKFDKGAT